MTSKRAHGTRSSYVRGCRCPLCTKANTDYQNAKRVRDRGLDEPDAQVIAMPMTPRPPIVQAGPDSAPGASAGATVEEMGPVEAAVRAELAQMTSTDRYPGLAESVVALAKILDRPKLSTTHPSAQRQMRASLDALWSKSTANVGRLDKVTGMSRGARGRTG